MIGAEFRIVALYSNLENLRLVVINDELFFLLFSAQLLPFGQFETKNILLVNVSQAVNGNTTSELRPGLFPSLSLTYFRPKFQKKNTFRSIHSLPCFLPSSAPSLSLSPVIQIFVFLPLIVIGRFSSTDTHSHNTKKLPKMNATTTTHTPSTTNDFRSVYMLKIIGSSKIILRSPGPVHTRNSH